MIDLTRIAPQRPFEPPADRAEAQARIAAIDDAVLAIRTQIAAADMKRQAGGRPLDPDRQHRARTALRHLKRERGEIQRAAAKLPGGRDRLKDRIIDVVREDYDPVAWDRVLERARRRLAEEAC